MPYFCYDTEKLLKIINLPPSSPVGTVQGVSEKNIHPKYLLNEFQDRKSVEYF